MPDANDQRSSRRDLDPTPPHGHCSILVAIPTFRRLALLETLLDSLVPELAEQDVLVLVGDNDCDPEVQRAIEARSAPLPLRYVPVAARGISQVRNGLIAAAGQLAPRWRWLVMLDDDGYVTPGWFTALMAAAEALDVDLIGGPVEGQLPDTASLLARNSVFAHRKRYPTGRIDMLNGMQNVAIRRSLIAMLGDELFDPRLGASGGEDHDLFKRAARAGATLGWCDEAVAIEPTPAAQLTTKALLYRYYSTGIYMGMLDRERHGAARELVGTARGLARGGIMATLGMAARRGALRAEGVLASAHYLGRLASLFGARSNRYATPDAGAR